MQVVFPTAPIGKLERGNHSGLIQRKWKSMKPQSAMLNFMSCSPISVGGSNTKDPSLSEIASVQASSVDETKIVPIDCCSK